jgi:hypothetical protein
MPLPTSGPISFVDFVIEQELPGAGAPQQLNTMGVIFGVSFTEDGSNSLGMDEFYGKSSETYDIYNAFVEGQGDTYYAVPFQSSNPFQSSFGGSCFTKQTGPPGIKIGQVLSFYPTAQFLGFAGPTCGDDGFEPF